MLFLEDNGTFNRTSLELKPLSLENHIYAYPLLIAPVWN